MGSMYRAGAPEMGLVNAVLEKILTLVRTDGIYPFTVDVETYGLL